MYYLPQFFTHRLKQFIFKQHNNLKLILNHPFQNRHQPLFLISSSPGFRANWLMLWVSCDTWPRRKEISSPFRVMASRSLSVSTFAPASPSRVPARDSLACSRSIWSFSALACAWVASVLAFSFPAQPCGLNRSPAG